MMRFRRAFTMLDPVRNPPLSGIALAAGYFDQSHMTAEFREFGDLTPREALSIPRFSEDVVAVGTPA